MPTPAEPSSAFLFSVHAGRVAPLGPDAVPSGFVKHSVSGTVAVTALGLAGDEQADLAVHGGPEKAVYAYAASRYPAWAKEFPALAGAFTPGAMGENLSISGMDERDICVGDVHAIGTALLQVCQPRQPCFKLGLRHGQDGLAHAMTVNGYSGWYYRVLRTGLLSAGDGVTLHDRPNPDFAFARLVEIAYRGRPAAHELSRMAQMPGLASQWQVRARKLLEARQKDGLQKP